MSKNKIIFLIIWWIILVWILLLVSSLNKSKTLNENSSKEDISNYSIWIVKDDKTKFVNFLETFRLAFPSYANTNFSVTSFNNFDDYYETLKWAFLKWNAPDMFVLNNSEKVTVFDDQIMWIDPSIISPKDLDNYFEPVFGSDLILSTDIDFWEEWVKKIDYIKWVPLWYEIPWVFYNYIDLKWFDLSSWSWINDAVSKLSKKSDDKFIPIWLWNWSWVIDSFDLLSAILIQNGLFSISDLDDKKLAQSLYTYTSFWDINWDNKFNSVLPQIKDNKTSYLRLFSEGKIWLVFWYPRLIYDIDNSWFKKSLLKAWVFPQESKSNWKSLVNYNYFVMNKNSLNSSLSLDLITYFSSENWEKEFLKEFNYYLPAHLSLLSRKKDEKLLDWYKVTLWDFYDTNTQFVSFDKKLKTIFDSDVKSLLDLFKWHSDLYEELSSKINCKFDKYINQLWLWNNCYK